MSVFGAGVQSEVSFNESQRSVPPIERPSSVVLPVLDFELGLAEELHCALTRSAEMNGFVGAVPVSRTLRLCTSEWVSDDAVSPRSEERRVGKECRSRWPPE